MQQNKIDMKLNTLEDLYKTLQIEDKTDNLIVKSKEDYIQSFINKTDLHYHSIDVLAEKIKPDGVFLLNKKPFILFFDFTQFTELKKIEEEFSNISKNIWNFNQAPFVITLTNNPENKINIYNGFDLQDPIFDNGKPKFKLQNITSNDSYQLNDFNYYELLTGKIFTKDILNKKNHTSVDYKLLKNIESAQQKLSNNIQDIKLINALLGKIIYIRYIIDRQISINNLPNNIQLTRESLIEYYLKKKEQFKILLDTLKQQFNGNVFEIKDEDYAKLNQNCFDTISSLLTQDIKKQQPFLFEVYDFSIIPVEFISCLYEQLLQNQQQKNGAYYTPICLVDYIINKTVVPFLASQQDRDVALYHCAVLDPTCGSGIFLVQTLKKILDTQQRKQQYTKLSAEKINKIVEQNIFGIDKDESAIDIAIFSIYLTLLDYYDENDIKQGQFIFPSLKNTNLFARDYLLNINVINEITNIFHQNNITLNFILGNPPWAAKPVNSKMLTKKQQSQLNKILAIDQNMQVPVEICCKFLLQNYQLLKLLNNHDVISALVIPSSILVNPSQQLFRQQFILEHNLVLHVLDLSAVKDILFQNAKTPASLVIYKTLISNQPNKIKLRNDNIVEYSTLKPNSLLQKFSLITIYRDDIKFVPQIKFLQEDILWNIFAVGGSFLDFNLITKIKKRFEKIITTLENENLTCAEGMNMSGGKSAKDNVSDLISRSEVQLSAIKRFIIDETKVKAFDKQIVERSRRETNPNLFNTSPILLKPRAIDKAGYMFGAISKKPYIFNTHILGIFANNPTERSDDILNNLLALIHSDLFAYFTFISCNILQGEEITKEAFLKFPFIEDAELTTFVQNINKIINTPTHGHILENESAKISKEDQINQVIKLINERIKTLCNFSQEEASSFDYALQFALPLYHNTSYQQQISTIDDTQIRKYAKVFIDYFEPIYGVGKFKIKILLSQYLVLCSFFLNTQETNINSDPVSIDNDIEDNILKQLITFSATQITDRFLFIKDIRGFCTYENSSGFFIAKHNNLRLWQPYNAYLDVSYFVNLMMGS
jgi:hypothetical protein